jgi:hypothetical protein
MANKSHRRLSDQERDERRRADRERLQRSAEQLLSSEGWQRSVRVRSHAGLARLSLSNQLLVALARPDATFVSGFKAWLNLGYCVKKGERAIAITAKRAILHRMRSRLLATSVLPDGVWARAEVDGRGDSLPVCGVDGRERLVVCISCVMVASDAKPD